MKKLFIILIMLLNVSLASAKSNSFIGSWMSEKIVVDGKEHLMYLTLLFEDDHDIIADDMVFGIWKYDKKSKLLNIKAFSINDLNGDWEIKEASKSKMILKMGNLEWSFFRYDKEKTKQENIQAGLEGSWILDSRKSNSTETATEAADDDQSQEETWILNFTDSIYFKLKTFSECYSSSQSGSWIYNPKAKSLIFIASHQTKILGNASIKEKNDKQLVIENNKTTYTFKKLEVVKIENLDFDYEYLDQNNKHEDVLPWSDFALLSKEVKEIKTLVYQKGIYNTDLGIYK